MPVKNVQFAYDSSIWNRKNEIAKALGKCTWPMVMEAGITALEEQAKLKPEKTEVPEPEEPKEPQVRYLQIDVPLNVEKREFDILRNNQWRTCPVDEIEIEAIFRVRDDGIVQDFDGVKKFIKKSHQEAKQDGCNYVAVISA